MFYAFCLFTPLYRRFRLSRVSQRIDLDEIYRLVSKILNFMPCGSVLDRFCVAALRMPENLLKIYRKSIEKWRFLSMLTLGHQNLHFYGVPGLPGGPSSERVPGGVCTGRSMHTWVKVPENTDPGIPHNRGGISADYKGIAIIDFRRVFFFVLDVPRFS